MNEAVIWANKIIQKTDFEISQSAWRENENEKNLGAHVTRKITSLARASPLGRHAAGQENIERKRRTRLAAEWRRRRRRHQSR